MIILFLKSSAEFTRNFFYWIIYTNIHFNYFLITSMSRFVKVALEKKKAVN